MAAGDHTLHVALQFEPKPHELIRKAAETFTETGKKLSDLADQLEKEEEDGAAPKAD